jgi:HAMP domain-containing protein
MAESLSIFRVLTLERENLSLRMMIALRDDEIYELSKEVDKLKREIERGRSDKVEYEQRPV